jgi:hypothetical protein
LFFTEKELAATSMISQWSEKERGMNKISQCKQDQGDVGFATEIQSKVKELIEAVNLLLDARRLEVHEELKAHSDPFLNAYQSPYKRDIAKRMLLETGSNSKSEAVHRFAEIARSWAADEIRTWLQDFELHKQVSLRPIFDELVRRIREVK